MEKRIYHGIEWLRAMACIGILVWHVKANNSYVVPDIFNKVITSFDDLVYLFMAISSFCLCCTYYPEVIGCKMDWTEFYKKRYAKLLPFFSLLIFLDVMIHFSIDSLLEGVTELTLFHGFVPIDFSVIGVGWFIGMVFIFYLVFPFFCVLTGNKVRAWISFVISICISGICLYHFGLSRHNFLCSFCYFMAGGIIYLYKDKLEKTSWKFLVPIVVAAVFTYYFLGENILTRLFMTTSLLVVAISSNVKVIKPVTFLSGISMEIYLSHMVIFRLIEKVHLNLCFGNGWIQYVFTCIMVIVFTVIFSWIMKRIIDRLKNVFWRKRHE